MNAGIAQLAALTAHGNCALAGSAPAAHVDLAGNSTFRFVGELSFERPKSAIGLRPRSRTLGHSVVEWYASLRAEGVRRLFLTRTLSADAPHLEPRHAVAFAGGEQAGVVAVHPRGRTELWVPEWRVADPKAPDQRIWAVTYRGSEGPPLFPEIGGLSPASAAAALERVLKEVRDFAAHQGLSEWVPYFVRAERLLLGADVEPPYHPDLLPGTRYSTEARRLLNACIGAWVFGGMGSWNDTGPDDAEEIPHYEALSAELFEAVMNGLVSATNAFEE
jgi:hypothetical protein